MFKPTGPQKDNRKDGVPQPGNVTPTGWGWESDVKHVMTGFIPEVNPFRTVIGLTLALSFLSLSSPTNTMPRTITLTWRYCCLRTARILVIILKVTHNARSRIIRGGS